MTKAGLALTGSAGSLTEPDDDVDDELPVGTVTEHAGVTQPQPQPPAGAARPEPSVALDGSWSWGPVTLTPDQVRVADDAYDRFRAAEGRDLFGGYSGTGLTTMMRDIADGLEYGLLPPESEQDPLLGLDTFRARFADLIRRYPDRTAELLARRVPAAISYSLIFDGEHYSAGIWMVQDALTAAGFQLLARRNDWNSTTNRCVATMWQDHANDLPFEVQFHTTASLEAQQLARSSATLINDPRVPADAATSLRSDLAAAWAALPAPPGNRQISDYRRENGSATPGGKGEP